MKVFLVLLPVGVIAFCCWFFCHVFDRTMTQSDKGPSVVQISFEENCATNAAVHTMFKDRVTEIISDTLTDRAKIAEKEHDRFRAELATWLSVFGLLTILVTLIAPVCSLVFQQKEVDRLQRLIEGQARKYEEIEKKVRMAEDAKAEAVNVADAIKDINEPKILDNLNPNGIQPDMKLKSMLYDFKILWGGENEERKIQCGLFLFEECDKAIDRALNSNNVESLVNCLNILNAVSAYMGTRNLERFRPHFLARLQEERPLKHSNDTVVQALKTGGYTGPITGFYNSALNLQGGVPK